MITAITPGEPVEYIAEDDRKSENPTTWKFRNLTLKQEDYIHDLYLKSSKGKSTEQRAKENMRISINLCLLGADNFKNKKGEDAEFTRDEKAPDVFDGIKPWTDETLQQIPFLLRMELYRFIVNGYTVIDEKTLKNS